MWKKWILAFSLGLLAVFLTACGDSPKDVAIEAIEAAYRGDTQKYLSYIIITDEDRRKGLNEGKVEIAMRDAKNKANMAGGVKKIEALSEEINGDTARVRVHVHFENGTSEKIAINLRKVDNRWTIE